MDDRTLHDSRQAWDPGFAALALLPLVLLALDSDWIFSGPHRDAWIYYGYFENAVAYLRRFQEQYYSSRPAVFLPGFLLNHLLSPVAANVVLHLAVYWSAVLSFYLVARDLFGRRTALLAGLALGCHPYFLQAAGWNYVDGFGIAYFLAALLLLTRAAGSPRWRLLLLGAGALGTALVSTNVFYGVVYLPLLAGHFLVLNRRRIPLTAAVLWTGLGAAALLAGLGALLRAAGGSFFYLGSSLQFLSGTIGTRNPFRDPTYMWLLKAVWLVFPATALLGGAFLLWRARTDPALRQNRPLLWCQIQLVLVVLVTVYFQVFGDTGVLQHFFYASLLIPCAFLAFAGQLAQMAERLPYERFSALVAAVALLQIVPLFVPIFVALKPRAAFSTTALLALLAGLVVTAALGWRTGGARAVLAVFFGLAVSQLLVRQEGTIFRQFERHGGDGRGLFSQVGRAVTAIETFDPSENVRLWYEDGEEDGVIYDAVASAFLLCPRMINLDFPSLPAARMCDGLPLGPGVPIAVLSADPAAFAKADAAMRGVGLSARLLGREEIPGPSHGFAITYLRTEAAAP
jgi:4-amino-4-deoxy-L-arabinose transferase-like glycosyltransferase